MQDTRRAAGRWSIRWNEGAAARAYADGWWSRETLGDPLVRAAVETPDRVLIVDGDVRLTAADLHHQATALARGLIARYPPGSVISFMLPNWHEAAVVYLGSTLAGMVAHPVLPSLRAHDLNFMLADVGSSVIFIPSVFRGHDYAAMLGGIEAAPDVVVVRGDAGLGTAWADMFAATNALLPDLDPDAVRMVMYTSGTTGRAKGVLHTHNSIHALIRQIGQHWRIDPGDAFLVPSPVSHIGGSIYAFECPLLLGSRAVLMDSWNPQAAVALIAAERVTHMAGATPFLRGLLDAARAAGTRLPELKIFICGGASVPPSLVREAQGYFKCAEVSRVYGSTEVPVTTVGALGEHDIAADTDGRPGIAEVRLADDGEIRARGPQMLLGYVQPQDEAAAFDGDGFYCTGDQGRLDNGALVVTGRIKDIIIRNGENISPKEIEDLLLDHPAVAEIAIVGVPDARTGERAVAVIVPVNDAPTVADLAAFLSARGVAKFKLPERVEARAALPKNEAGKVLKHVLRLELS